MPEFSATGPARGKDLRAEDLARNIELADRNGMRSRALEVGEQMMAEDGSATAVSAIETLMAA